MSADAAVVNQPGRVVRSGAAKIWANPHTLEYLPIRLRYDPCDDFKATILPDLA